MNLVFLIWIWLQYLLLLRNKNNPSKGGNFFLNHLSLWRGLKLLFKLGSGSFSETFEGALNAVEIECGGAPAEIVTCPFFPSLSREGVCFSMRWHYSGKAIVEGPRGEDHIARPQPCEKWDRLLSVEGYSFILTNFTGEGRPLRACQ